MTQFRHFSLAALTVALLSVGGVSHAVVLSTAGGSTQSFSWSLPGGTSGSLQGTGSFTVDSSSTSSALILNVTLGNTSTVSSDRLTSFGFGINPNATSVTFSDPQGNDGGMVAAVLSTQQGSTQIPSLQGIEICAWGGNNCAGGSQGGILGGGSDSFTLTLAGSWGSSVNIDPIGFKYQTDVGSYEFTTSSGTTTSGKVPEPHSTALVGLGLVALGAGFLRRRKQVAA